MSGTIGNLTWSALVGTTSTPGSIARWLNKSTLGSGAASDADLILQEATGWIVTRLRHWQMLTAPIRSTMSVGDDTITVPADMLEPDFIMIAGLASDGNFYQQTLVQKPINDIYMAWGYDGQGNRLQQTPRLYSFNASKIQMDAQPDLAYPYVFTYYQRPALLSTTNQTNFLTSLYPRLLRCACMMLGAEWTKENMQGSFDRTYWEQAAQAELMEVQAQSDRARRAAVADPTFPGSLPGYAPYGSINYW